jgi:hypothetical protein
MALGVMSEPVTVSNCAPWCVFPDAALVPVDQNVSGLKLITDPRVVQSGRE